MLFRRKSRQGKSRQALKRKRQAEFLAKGKNEIPEWVFLSKGSLKKNGRDGERDDFRELR